MPPFSVRISSHLSSVGAAFEIVVDKDCWMEELSRFLIWLGWPAIISVNNIHFVDGETWIRKNSIYLRDSPTYLLYLTCLMFLSMPSFLALLVGISKMVIANISIEYTYTKSIFHVYVFSIVLYQLIQTYGLLQESIWHQISFASLYLLSYFCVRGFGFFFVCHFCEAFDSIKGLFARGKSNLSFYLSPFADH